MFVLQRILESDGYFTLLDKNKVVKQNKYFRLFATANTVGLGDTTGLYTGVQNLNAAQLDRWNIIVSLNYLGMASEIMSQSLSGCPSDTDSEVKVKLLLLNFFLQIFSVRFCC